jgi:hypothetical protein
MTPVAADTVAAVATVSRDHPLVQDNLVRSAEAGRYLILTGDSDMARAEGD